MPESKIEAKDDAQSPDAQEASDSLELHMLSAVVTPLYLDILSGKCFLNALRFNSTNAIVGFSRQCPAVKDGVCSAEIV